jgi:hypothetical protein
MPETLPVVLIPGLNCSARLYAEQIPALWRFGPVQVADHTRDDSMDVIASRILAAAPSRFALAGLSIGGYLALNRSAGVLAPGASDHDAAGCTAVVGRDHMSDAGCRSRKFDPVGFAL